MTPPDPPRHDDDLPGNGPAGESYADLRKRLGANHPAKPPTALERHAAAQDHAVATGGYPDADEYLAALQLKARGKADALTIYRINHTHPDVIALAERPG